MVTAVRPTLTRQSQNRLLQPRQSSQRLRDKALSIEERIHNLRDSLSLSSRAEAIEGEVRELAEQLLKEKPLNPWKYWELKRELIAIAAVAGITLTLWTNHVTLEKVTQVGQPQLVIPTLVQPSAQAPVTPRSELRPEAPLNQDRGQAEATGIKLDALAQAFISQESGGQYNLTNKDSGALGYFQVMPFNIPSWTQEALGYQLSPASFLNSPNLQLKVGKHKLRQYLNQETKPGRSEEEVVRRVASLWYSGKARLWNNTKPQTYGGNSYPSIASYTKSVYKKYRSELGQPSTQPEPEPKSDFWGQGLETFQSKFQTAPTLKPVVPSTPLSTAAIASPPAQDVLAQRIVAAMEKKGFPIARGEGEVNIIYLRRGAWRATNSWDARRIVITFKAGTPRIVFDAEATSYPGDRYIFGGHPRGGPILKDGHYSKVWAVGTHIGLSGTNAHEALVQVAPLRVWRDSNRDRVGDSPETGIQGINIHGSRRTSGTVEAGSAGCPVTRGMEPHREFMEVVKSDPRFESNRNFRFSATFINQRDLG